MSSNFSFATQSDDAPRRKSTRGGARRPPMGGKQIEAYLIAKETLRSIQRKVAQAHGRTATRH